MFLRSTSDIITNSSTTIFLTADTESNTVQKIQDFISNILNLTKSKEKFEDLFEIILKPNIPSEAKLALKNHLEKYTEKKYTEEEIEEEFNKLVAGNFCFWSDTHPVSQKRLWVDIYQLDWPILETDVILKHKSSGKEQNLNSFIKDAFFISGWYDG